MNDKTRAEFEEVFPPPSKCWWSEKSNAYCWAGLSVTRHPHDELWQAWLAAKGRYEPSTKQQKAKPEGCAYEKAKRWSRGEFTTLSAAKDEVE